MPGLKKVIIIGSGVGGITIAIHLAQKGYQVKIVEKNSYPGGRCGNIVKDGHRFDIGATLLMMTDIYEKTYQSIGRDLYKELDLIRMDPIYSIKFPEGKQVLFSSDLAKLQNQLEAIEPGCYNNFLKYMAESYSTYKLSMKHIIDRNYYNALEFFSLKNLLLLFKLKAFKNHYKHTTKFFKSEILRVVFTFQNIYVGQNPFKASAIFAMLPFLELTDGVWFPKGGMQQIIQNLISIAAEHQVEMVYNSTVEKINVEGKKVTGITLSDKSSHNADIIVSNADLPYVYEKLLPKNKTINRIKKLDYTCSAFMFHWGLDKTYPQLEQHNVFVSKNYKENIDSVFTDLTLPSDPSFYVHAPSRTDKSAAPENEDTLSIIVPVGHINGDEQNWNALQDHARKLVIERLKTEGMKEIDQHIKFEICYNPKSWKTIFNLSRGSVFGSLSHNLMQMGYMRPHNQHKKYKNLFFVGGSTHPGNGIPMVLLSAKLTTEKILKYHH
jgi:phytoene desaturase